eukprot:Gregarina_sp_Poly_1__2254@NODE_15_length_23029_cov_81_474305_g13_i0_p6_GENE_NODE_15_length_23029_cov_81_474305_g13_i0NODE_15_length_23029_cov_81_474305_g13_i0_p6_ORF_typecomplete_len440_score46_76Mur_ligase_M/PF08245_12/2_8e19Mur_ligase_C/PF02875_21/6e02Mur_ligase_C/PF02875_21/0_0004_NODE_15_length_23029_cov_81_474305_g13_i082419560
MACFNDDILRTHTTKAGVFFAADSSPWSCPKLGKIGQCSLRQAGMRLDVLKEELLGSISRFQDLNQEHYETIRPDGDIEVPQLFRDALKALEQVKRLPENYAGEHLVRLNEFRVALGEPDLRLKIVHVGGTNGKGSVATKIAYGLCAQGYRVGLLTSPHILSARERVSVDGVPIRYDEWMGIHNFIKLKEQKLGMELSWSQHFTMLAALYFWLRKCEFAVCEVGLGGKLDSTNIFPSKVLTVITSIGLDHCNVLGDTREAIGAQKAAIINPHGVCVLGPDCRTLDSVATVATTKSAALVFTQPKRDILAENDRLAQTAVSFLLNSSFNPPLDLPEIPGRFQFIAKTNTYVPVILDVGHNVSAFEAITSMFKWRFPNVRHLTVMMAISKKRKLSIFDPLLSIAGEEHTKFFYLPCEHELILPWNEERNDNRYFELKFISA